MSLILEALRKSEAQRRLGQAPDLHSPVIAMTPRRRLPRWLLPALALMLVGALAWWFGHMAVPDPSNGMATEAVVEPLPLPLDIGGSHATGGDDAGPAPVAPPSTTTAARGEISPPTPPPATAGRPTGPPAPAATAPGSTPASEAVTAAAAPPAPAPPPSRPPTSDTAMPPVATQPAPAFEPPAATPGTQATADSDEGLLRLADLPAATRATLPELRISMHVFAEDPSRRFAIIDGRRVGEGGLLEGQGVVEAIRRDGIVVDFEGRRVLLPRP